MCVLYCRARQLSILSLNCVRRWEFTTSLDFEWCFITGKKRFGWPMVGVALSFWLLWATDCRIYGMVHRSSIFWGGTVASVFPFQRKQFLFPRRLKSQYYLVSLGLLCLTLRGGSTGCMPTLFMNPKIRPLGLGRSIVRHYFSSSQWVDPYLNRCIY